MPTNVMVLLINTDIDKNTDDNEYNDGRNLERRKPVFHFAIRFDMDSIDAN